MKRLVYVYAFWSIFPYVLTSFIRQNTVEIKGEEMGKEKTTT